MRCSYLILALCVTPIGLVGGEPAPAAAGDRRITVGMGDQEIPLLVDGGGWKTSILLTNLSPLPAPYRVLLWTDEPPTGSPEGFPVEGRGIVQSVTGVLGPNQSAEIATPGQAAEPRMGEAHVFTYAPDSDPLTATPTPNRLGGLVTYRLRAPGSPDSRASIPLGTHDSSPATVFFDNRDGRSAAVVISLPLGNHSIYPPFGLPVSLKAWAPTGELLLESTIKRQTPGKFAFSLTDRFPELRGKRGVLRVEPEEGFASMLLLQFGAGGGLSVGHPMTQIQ